jgi:hypothetical protein
MKTLTRKQQLLLLAGLIVFSLIYYFRFNKKSTESNFSDLDKEKILDITTWNNIGDGFFVPNTSYKGLAKKYIDGTIVYGKILNEKGEYLRDTGNVIQINGGAFQNQLEMTVYPKDKGFMKADGKGNYFYFEPLPDFKMAEIDRLVKLQNDANQAAIQAKNAEDLRKAAEAQRLFELKQTQARAKAAADNKRAADANKIATEKQLELTKKLESSKNKKIAAIVIVLILSVIAFIWYKKRQNS